MVDRRASALSAALGDGWDPAPLAPVDRSARPDTPAAPPTRDGVWAALAEVPDPEVPAVSVVDLGIVRDVEIDAAGGVTVVITPTYSGCPAMREIERDVVAALAARGWADATVRTEFSPAWTTDWMSDAAREKMRAYGIAPPRRTAAAEQFVVLRRRSADRVACPFCGSAETALRSEFGATACKAMHYCNACHQPFEAFKAI